METASNPFPVYGGGRIVERRWHGRDTVAWKACVWFRDECIEECTVKDISADGMYIEFGGTALPMGAQVKVAYFSDRPGPELFCAKGLVVHSERGGAGLLTEHIECGESERKTVAA